jgi:hypothetical protein
VDFARVLGLLATHLRGSEQPFALIGGLAIAAYGYARNTLDLDLAVDASAQDPLIAHLEALGYVTLHRSAGYSNHLHRDPELGRVNVVYVRGETSRLLFSGVRMAHFLGSEPIPTASPEHLAAMKALAIRSDPARTFQDLADVRFLLTLPGVDRDAIRAQFRRQGLAARFDELLATL